MEALTVRKTYKGVGTLVGVLLGLGAPAGALFFRILFEGDLSFAWLANDVTEHLDFYVYMVLSTPTAFGIFGAYLGRLQDEIISQKQSLEMLNTLLKAQSMTDDTTGLFNHRHLMEEIEKELTRARRYKRFLSGMMVDIDNFKEINDYYGHLTGDSVLREVAELLKKSLRKVDIVGRYGGDEFLIILPETNGDVALAVAQRIQKDIQQHRFRTMRDYITVSVSIGVVHFSDSKDFDKTAFVEKLDEAMYKAKSLGKDRIYS